MNDFLHKLITKLSCKKVGTDEFGNSYWKTKNTKKNKKRFVIYNGIAEPSKIPAHWHQWIHHVVKNTPTNISSCFWQKIHLPNLTGTFRSRLHVKNKKVMNVSYCPWKPS